VRATGALDLAALAAALGCGLVAGTFFGFSTFIMTALGRLPAPTGVAAMQSINVVVLESWFVRLIVGTALLSVLLVVAAPLRWGDPRAPYWLAGGILYLVGTLLVTLACNVPRNQALAVPAPASAEAASLWTDYLSSWTLWNHVRTAAALAAALAFTLGLVARG
jgi:uncharacterized membrane protein